MRTKILLSIFVLFFLAACNKDKYNTTPTLTLKSTSDKNIPVNGSLQVEFELTDKEGDISDTLYFKKIRTNKRVATLVRDSLVFPIPQVSNTKKIALLLNLTYNDHLRATQSGSESDSLTLQVWIKDKANNKSAITNITDVVVKH
jgi:hypothetical protein